MAKPVYSTNQIVNVLTDGGLSWHAATITYSFPSMQGYRIPGDAYQVNATQRAYLREAMGMWEDLADINLQEVANNANADITFYNRPSGGTYTSHSYYTNGALADAYISFDQSWSSNQSQNLSYSSYGYLTMLHEIGHALGLEHPGHYNGSANFATDAEFAQDSHRHTVMSYFADGLDDSSGASHYYYDGIGWRWVFPQTPMLYDVAAIQEIYGANTTTRTGNTVYGYNANAGHEVFNFAVNKAPVLTIYDAGGKDTLNLSGDHATHFVKFTYDAYGNPSGWSAAINDATDNYHRVIDLTPGSFSSTHGMDENIAIAFGTIIENAVGTEYSDEIQGNKVANRLVGGGGNDELHGANGNDNLLGGLDADRLYGDRGYDRLNGGTEADFLNGGVGFDTLRGGSGDDRLYGMSGSDQLYGGDGADIFAYSRTSDSMNSTKDVINDFSSVAGDRIDLSAIDANQSISGDQAFTFIGNQAFTDTAGELRFAGGKLQGDTNGDGLADFSIIVKNVANLASADFVL